MSMSNDELQQLLLATFADQAKEQLQTINERLLALEEAEGDDKGPLLEEIFREAHSLKGASRAVTLDRVEAVAHKLESLFSVIQKGELEADAEVFDLAYKALDALTALVEEGLAGTAADVDIEGLCASLVAATEGSQSPEGSSQFPVRGRGGARGRGAGCRGRKGRDLSAIRNRQAAISVEAGKAGEDG
jgi:chemotaxis protein histidine kinase CheA